ncbi:DMT family transporter [Iamia sp.]|uniref:DMT family transporter n=1 Tax=Iamia sp. TaxID=2722710 RepID=UPI002BEF3B1B|nr:DMT family transporter [Iamia sp.]HXH58575.1 DMT family transporter [Iamia sp.]
MRDRPGGAVLALVLMGGVLAASTAALFTRGAYDAAGAGTLGGGLLLAVARMTITSALTAPAWIERRHAAGAPPRPTLPAGTRARTVLAGALLGLHFATWLPSLVYTSIAASSTIVTTGPIWVALLLWLRGERPSGRAGLGITVAVAGGGLVAFGNVEGLDSGANPLLGNALALVAAITFAGHLLLGRSVQHRGLGLWRWTAVVAGVGALTVLPLALLAAPGDGPYPAGFWAAAVALALVPQLLGHSSFTWTVRWLSPTLVSSVILLEPLFSGLGGVLLFDEVPGAVVIAGAVALIAGVALTTVAEQDRSPLPAEAPLGPP